jgi:hypothetical protein
LEIRSRTSTSLRVRSPTGLERLYRDSRSGPFQPMTTDQTYEHLGKFELGLMEMPGCLDADLHTARAAIDLPASELAERLRGRHRSARS